MWIAGGSTPIRSWSARLAGVLGIAALAGLAAGVPAATAGDRIDQAAAALREEPFYLDPGARALLTPTQAAGINDRLRRTATPIFIAVLPVAATGETGHDPGRLPGALWTASGRRPGTYAVLAGPYFRAGSTELGTDADEIAQDALDAAEGDRTEAILRFVEEVEVRLWHPPPLGSTESTETHRRSPGFPWTWFFGLLALLLGGLALWAKLRTSKHAQQDLEQVGVLLEDDLRALGRQVEHARATLSAPGQDAVLLADYARALDGLHKAQQRARDVSRHEDAIELARILDETRYALASALARAHDQPLPIRSACLFDPLHPAPAVEVPWAPDGAEVRFVPACPADANRLAAGAQPLCRTVPGVDGPVPYWAAGTSLRSWARGWYGTGYDAEQLYQLFAGTALGAGLDDPALPTGESPFEGWAEDVQRSPEPSR